MKLSEEIAKAIDKKTISLLPQSEIERWQKRVQELETASANYREAVARLSLRNQGFTRVEVIDDTGRLMVARVPKGHVELSFQDDDRTLKVFIFKDPRPKLIPAEQSGAELS